MEKTIYQDSYICIVEDTYNSGTLTIQDSSLYGGRIHVLVSNGMTRYWLYNSDKSIQFSHSDNDAKYGYKSISKPCEGVIRLEFADNRWYYLDVFGNPLNRFPFTCAEDFSNGFAVVDAINGFGGCLLDHAGNLLIKSDKNKFIQIPEGYRSGFFINDDCIALQAVYESLMILCDKDLNPINYGKNAISFISIEKGPLDWCVYLTDCYCYPNRNINDKKCLFNLSTKTICYHGPRNLSSHTDGVVYPFTAIGDECVCSIMVVDREDKEWDSDEHQYDYTRNKFNECTLCFKNGKVVSAYCRIEPQEDKQIIIIKGEDYIYNNDKRKSNFGCLSFSGDDIVPILYSNLRQIGNHLEVELDGMTYQYNYEGSLIYNNVALPKGIHAYTELQNGKILVKQYLGGWKCEFSYGVFDIDTMSYLLPMCYSSFKKCSENSFIISKRATFESYGLVGPDFRFLLDCKYLSLEYISDESFICSTRGEDNTEYGIVNRKGSYIVLPLYGNISLVDSDRICFETHYKYGSGSRKFYTDYGFNTIVELSEGRQLTMNGLWNLLDSFTNGFSRFESGDEKYGIVNEKSSVIVKAKYDTLETTDIPYIYFGSIGNTHYLINLSCSIEKEIKCTNCWTESGENKSDYLFISKNNLQGLLDCKGEPVLDCIYSSISIYANEIIIKKAELVGKADRDGNIIIPCEYRNIDMIDKGYYIALKRYACLLSPYGTPIIDESKQYNSIEMTGSECLMTLKINSNSERHYGLISKKGRIIREPELSHIGSFVNGVAIVNLGGSKKLIYNRLKGHKEMSLVGGKFGLMKDNGELIAEPVYDYLGKESSGYHIVAKKSDSGLLFGIISSKGDVILECKYRYVRNVSENLIVYAIGGEWQRNGLNKEKLTVPKINDGMCYLKGAKWGVLDINGNIIVAPFADHMRYVSEGKLTYKLSGKYGVIELQTQVRHQTDYDYLSAFFEGRCIAGKLDSNNQLQYGYIKDDYTEIVPCIYAKAYHYKNGEGCLQNGRTQYYFDLEGKQIMIESENDCSSDSYDDYDWERETWFAMTDGQYGDYPGPGVDYDFLG